MGHVASKNKGMKVDYTCAATTQTCCGTCAETKKSTRRCGENHGIFIEINPWS